MSATPGVNVLQPGLYHVTYVMRIALTWWRCYTPGNGGGRGGGGANTHVLSNQLVPLGLYILPLNFLISEQMKYFTCVQCVHYILRIPHFHFSIEYG